MDRRTFVGLAAGLFWRERVRGERLARVGLHLASVRNASGVDLGNALRMVAGLGYREVELSRADDPTVDPRATRRLLDDLGLTAPSRHVAMSDVFSNWRLLLRECQVLGNRHIVCAEIPARERGTLDGYKRVADLLTPAGRIIQAGGLQLVLRPHPDDFRPRGAIVPYDYVLNNTDPALVRLQLDLSDLVRARRDPVEELTRHPGRVASLHVNDVAAEPKEDLPRILARARQAGIGSYFVNDRRPGAPWEHAKGNFAYLSKLEF